MKTMRQLPAKRWHVLVLMLWVMTGVAADSDVNQTQAAESLPSGQVSTADSTVLGRLISPLKVWVGRHTGLTILLLTIILLLAWFRNKIRDAATEKIQPIIAQHIAGVFSRVGAHRTLLGKYRQALQDRLQSGGLRRGPLGEGIDLEKNYVALDLSKSEQRPPDTDEEQEAPIPMGLEAPEMERVDVHDVLTDETNYGNRIAIIGDPGSGKTTLMQYLAYQCAKEEGIKPIPALIPLTAYLQHGALGIRAYLETDFAESGFPRARGFIDEALKRGDFLILFDGFDEVEMGRRAELKRHIITLANNRAYLQNKFVIASRPVRDATFDTFRHLEVMPLTPDQRRRFLQSRMDDGPESGLHAEKCAELVGAIEANPSVRKLAENPLLLTFLYHVYKYNLELPRRRVELYRLAIDLMLDWDIQTNRPTPLQVKYREAKKEVLRKVAHYFHTHQRRELPEKELLQQVDRYLPDALRERFTAKTLMLDIENSSGILRHRTAESYQFIHLTFQEYLTADYVNINRDEEVPQLLPLLRDAWWREVTLLLASRMGNATPLVRHILDYGQGVVDEAERFSYLFIAFSCLFEAQVDVNARDEVLAAWVQLPHHQILEVTQRILGAIEPGNEAMESLLVNILDSRHESVRRWGFKFLKDYPQLVEASARLTERIAARRRAV